MSKVLPAAVAAGDPYTRAGAVRFDFDGGPFRYWGCGRGEVTIAGEGVFTGLEATALLAPVRSAMGSAASGVELVLSGLEPEVAAALSGSVQRGRAARIWKLYFDAVGTTLLGALPFYAGAVGPVVEREQVGGAVTVTIPIDANALDLEKSGGRMRSAADQALLGGPLDRSLKNVAFAGEKQLYWGAFPPGNAGAVVPGTIGAISPGLQSFLLF